jgi:multidrug efflux pump subunit AcrA (membrane-fusion protein)
VVIVASLYANLVWLIFFGLKWLRWGWGSGTVTVIVGTLLCAVFVGFLSYLAPTGRVTVISRVVEVTPNVSGQIKEISVPLNQLVKAGTSLFKIDPAPYEAQSRSIDAQLKFQELRLSQMQQLQVSSSGRAFDVEQRQAEVDQLRAQMDKAQYDLDQTTIRTPADGYVSTLTLTIEEIAAGIGEGQIASSRTLARVTSLPMATEYAVVIARPKDIDDSAPRAGMSGTATVYAPNSAPLDTICWIPLYGRALTLYL